MNQILIVDDMPTMQEQARKVAGEKYELLFAGSAKEMFEMLKAIKPDLLLLDIFMPEMDGFECLQLLKEDEKTKDIPVIITATDSSIVSEAKGFTLGAADFLRKPFTEEIMFSRIDMQLELASYRKYEK